MCFYALSLGSFGCLRYCIGTINERGNTPKENKKCPLLSLKIAKIYSATIRERGDLEERNSDSEDFIDISVWGLKKMLEQAYALGAKREAK